MAQSLSQHVALARNGSGRHTRGTHLEGLMRAARIRFALATTVALGLAAPAVWAQGAGDDASESEPAAAEAGEEEGEPTAGEAGAASTEEGAGEAADTEAKSGLDTPPPSDPDLDSSPIEEPGKTYHFVGLRYRGIIVPKFMMNLFGEGGRTVYNHAFGPEFTIRKDAFEYVFSLWYASYAMKPTPFKASSDPEPAWEIVESKLKAIYLTTDFLWSQEFSPEFSLNYGMGAGFGIVFGDLFRTQSYPPSGQAGDPETYEPCIAVNNPNPTYCDDENEHYPGYKEPSWANGGSKPIIFPWLVLQTGVRYKPHRNFAARFDVGFGTSGFFIGLAGELRPVRPSSTWASWSCRTATSRLPVWGKAAAVRCGRFATATPMPALR